MNVQIKLSEKSIDITCTDAQLKYKNLNGYYAFRLVDSGTRMYKFRLKELLRNIGVWSGDRFEVQLKHYYTGLLVTGVYNAISGDLRLSYKLAKLRKLLSRTHDAEN